MKIEPMNAGSYRSTDHAPARERAYHLAIVAGPDATAWVARDAQKVTAMAWSRDESALCDPHLPKHPRTVTFVSLPEWSTLVPDGALVPGSDKAHLALVHGNLPASTVREEPVRTLAAQCLYMNEARAERTVLEQFANARSLPLQAVLVNGALGRSHDGCVVLLHRGADRMDIALAERELLLLSTSYPARTSEDVLYYCLMAIERVGRLPDQVVVRSGGTHLCDGDRAILDRYFRDHRPAVDPALHDQLSGVVHAERWLAAFDQAACVS